jgi:methylated-DNA-[protein]-cysteine S-methyltransferase
MAQLFDLTTMEYGMIEETLYIDYMDCQFGILEICANTHGISTIAFVPEKVADIRPNKFIQQTISQLQEYFSGRREKFELTLNPKGTTFQRQVWQTLLTIPFGQTRSYADIANDINNPKAVRAVGAANGRNPLTIVVPCHRVIGKNGHLTGYAWGTAIKAGLLALEKG